MERVKKQRGNNSLLVLLCLLIVLFAIMAVLSRLGIGKLQGYSTEAGSQNMDAVCEQIEQAYDFQIDALYTRLDQIENILFLRTNRDIRLEDAKVSIDALIDASSEQLIFMKSNGQALTTSGEELYVDIQASSLKQLQQKQRIAQTISWTTGNKKDYSYLVAIPCEEFQVDGEKFGSIGLVFSRDVMDTLINISAYNGAAYLYFVDNSGIITYTNQNDSRYFRSFSLLKHMRTDGYLTEEQYSLLNEAFECRKTGTMLISPEGNPVYLGYRPVRVNDSMLLCIVPAEILNSSLIEYQKLVNKLLFIGMAVVGAIFVFILLAERKALSAARWARSQEEIAKIKTVLNEELQKKQVLLEENAAEQEAQLEEITALNAELEESTAEQEAQIEEITTLNTELRAQKAQMTMLNGQLEERLSIIRSTLNGYFAAYYIDLESYRYKELKSISSVQSLIDVEGNAQENLDKMCEHLILPEFKEKLLRFSDLSTAGSRMRGKDLISMRYIGITTGWSEAYMIASDRNADGTLKSLIWCTRRIHDEIEREQEYERVLVAAKEEAEAANNAKTSFLFNMSHDIRTPMNAIMGFRDLLEKHQEDPVRRADYLRKIEGASTVLLSIINNVLEMARIEKGTIELDETAWSAEQFNDTLYSIFNEMMDQKGITFTRRIDVTSGYVYCDPIKLREVFINILSNAYKYTNSGGSVNMHLEEIPSDREGYAMYRTTIADTGIGMSEDFLPHLFEEFTRESNTTDNKIEGTGLGMPIVKRLVELMSGTIEVRSKKGVGSTFIVTIPHRIADRASLVEHAGVIVDPKLFEGKRILLAEDNELNAEIALEILSEAGFIVDRAEDGVICCERLYDAPNNYYDLILMDIQMPNMNGYEATRTIRQMQDSAKSRIPILAMTANAFEEDRREAIRAGMNGHLSKPIDVSELMKALAGILG